MKKNPKISIIIPVFNEEECIERCFREVSTECNCLPIKYEIIFVNDGSKDKSYEILNQLASNNKCIKVIHFSRNFGQRPALLAGFECAYQRGADAIINLDCDLQDPASLIGKYLEKFNDGYDVVLGKRKKRKGESLFKKLTAKLYYKIFRQLSKTNTPKDCGISRLLSRRVVENILKMGEHNIYLAGMTEYVGFKQTIVEYDRDPRKEGKTKYSVKKLIKLAINNILPYSSTPISFIFGSGLFLGLSGLAMFVTLVVLSIIGVCFSNILWIIMALIIGFGLVVTSIGIIGAYIFLCYSETLNRPRYIVSETINIGENDG